MNICYLVFYRTIFGFSKDGFVFILDLILPKIRLSERKNPAYLTPLAKLCIFLDFLRTNSFQRVIGTQHHNQVSQSTSCKVINNIAHILAEMHEEVYND